VDTKKLDRRAFLRMAGLASAATVVAACKPQVVYETVEKVVKETIIVEGEEKVVEKVVVETCVVEKEVVKEAAGRTVIRHQPQGYMPRERLETDRWEPPTYFWVIEAKYEAMFPDVDIQFVEVPSGQGQDEWMTTQLVAGTAPEVFWIQRGWITRDYKKGWLVNLTPYLNEKSPYNDKYDTWYDIFQVPCIEAGKAPDGNIYMLTCDIVGTGQFYNKTAFASLGVEVPETWAAFDTAQRTLREGGMIPFSISMILPGGVGLWGSWSTRMLCDVLYDHKMGVINDNKGGTVDRTWKPGENLQQPIMARAIRDGRYGAKDPEWGEMCRILKEWSIHWPEGFWALDTGDVYRLWVTGDAAIDWEGSWQTKAVYNDPLREFEWGVFPNLPTVTTETSEFGGKPFPAMAGVGGAGQYAVSEAARERGTLDQTIDWMRFCTNPENLVPLLNDHGGFAPGVKDTEGSDPNIKVYVDQMVAYGTERMEPFDSMLTREFVDQLWADLQVFLAGEMTQQAFQDKAQMDMEAAAAEVLAENPDWDIEV